MKKIIKGALDKLTGGEVDPSKRNLIKGAGALGAIAVTPKVARRVSDEVGEPFLKKIDLSKMAAKQITDLPQMKKVLLDENILEGDIFLDEISEEYSDRLLIGKINIDHNQAAPQKYAGRSIPTLMLFKNGDVQAQRMGALSKSQLKDFLDTNL